MPPAAETSCTLPLLPGVRYAHTATATVDNHIILCGGAFTEDSCLNWSPDTGTWEELLTMDIERYAHVSWTPENGIGTYLIGRPYSGDNTRTTTLITSEGTQEPGFPLKYDTM